MRFKHILILTVVACLLASVAMAHPPGKMFAFYSAGEEVLKIKIDHGVGNVESHYIDKIKIYVNDKLVKEKTYDKQTDTARLTDDIPLKGVNKGDTIKIYASCNKFGSKTLEIVMK